MGPSNNIIGIQSPSTALLSISSHSHFIPTVLQLRRWVWRAGVRNLVIQQTIATG
jgi:hypothetical protein